MDIIPKLSLNANPKTITNNSLIYANNIRIDEEGVIQNDSKLNINRFILDAIQEKLFTRYEIVHCVECNEELVLFANNYTGNLYIFRYNEYSKKCIFVSNNFEYEDGDNLISTFTYNKNELIIAVGCHNSNRQVPLRVINLGEFGKPVSYINENQLYNSNLHSIAPKIKIPNVKVNVCPGNYYKGWSYIFIRYKISNNTYTDWLNTNESAFLDNYLEKKVLDYYVPNSTIKELKGYTVDFNDYQTYQYSDASVVVSDESDITNNTLELEFINLDYGNYSAYQVAIITISKTYTKCFYSDDISLANNICKVHNFKEYDINQVLAKHINYYNIKCLENNNNRLFISNYEEYDFGVEVDKLELDITLKELNIENKSITKYKLLVANKDNSSEKLQLQYYNNKQALIGGVTRKDYNNNVSLIKNDNFQTIYVVCELYKTTNGNESFAGYHIYPYKMSRLANTKDSGINSLVVIKNGTDITRPWEKYNKDNYLNLNETYHFALGSEDNKTIRLAITRDEISILQTKIKGIVGDSSLDWSEEIITTDHNTQTDLSQIPKYYFDSNKWDFANPEKEEESQLGNKLNDSILTHSVSLNQHYNFFIHFVNEYGEISNGYSISNFKNINLNQISGITDIELKLIDNKFIFLENEHHYQPIPYNDKSNFYKKYVLNFKLNKLPNNCKGYFVSYEELEKDDVYTGICYIEADDSTNKFANIYNDKFNYEDYIDFNFDKIILNEIIFNDIFKDGKPVTGTQIDNNTKNNVVNDSLFNSEVGANLDCIINSNSDTLQESEINNKTLYVAGEDYNQTYIRLALSNNAPNQGYYFYTLKNTNAKYNNNIKNLIPCSQVTYDLKEGVDANTKTSFISNINTLRYSYKKILYNSNSSVFTDYENGYAVIKPYAVFKYTYYDDVLVESLLFKNKPRIIVNVAKYNIYSNSDNSKTIPLYRNNTIIEQKDTVDLYNQNQLPYNKSNPVILTNYKEDDQNIFNNSIRRSNSILDESYEISWRKFNQDAYKNLPNNKGEIVKIVNSGNIMLIHTTHSLFVLDGSDTIKSNGVNDHIQLTSVDVWDIAFKELFSSKLGFGGIKNKNHSILGDFGYIWFDSNTKRIYRLDNNYKLNILTDNVINYLKLYFSSDIIFANDKRNNRILIADLGYNRTLSYNVNSNTFVSFHDYNFKNAFNTKNGTYILDIANQLLEFDDSLKMNCKIGIICNSNYDSIKSVDSIIYKLSDSKGNIKYYAGDAIRIYSEFCDTGTTSISTRNGVNNINSNIFWNLGTWNYNRIRNKLVEYDSNKINNIESSLVYGNYFIVELTFNKEEEIRIESIDFNVKLYK